MDRVSCQPWSFHHFVPAPLNSACKCKQTPIQGLDPNRTVLGNIYIFVHKYIYTVVYKYNYCKSCHKNILSIYHILYTCSYIKFLPTFHWPQVCIPMLLVTWSIYQQAICITDRCILPLIKQNKYRKGHTFLADIHARKHCHPTISVPKLVGNLMVSKFASSSQNGCANFSSQIPNTTDLPENWHVQWKGTISKGTESSNHYFSEAM